VYTRVGNKSNVFVAFFQKAFGAKPFDPMLRLHLKALAVEHGLAAA
jgi:hypothetical protein